MRRKEGDDSDRHSEEEEARLEDKRKESSVLKVARIFNYLII